MSSLTSYFSTKEQVKKFVDLLKNIIKGPVKKTVFFYGNGKSAMKVLVTKAFAGIGYNTVQIPSNIASTSSLIKYCHQQYKIGWIEDKPISSIDLSFLRCLFKDYTLIFLTTESSVLQLESREDVHIVHFDKIFEAGVEIDYENIINELVNLLKDD